MAKAQPLSNLKNDFYLFKRLAKDYLIAHYKIFILSVFLMIVIAATTSFLAWLVKPALDQVFVERNKMALIIIPLTVLLVTIIKGLATYFQLLTINLFSMNITAQMRKDLYAHFINSDIATLHNSSSGNMIASILNEVNSIVGAVNTVINGFVKQLFTLVFLVAVMFNQSLELSLVAFVGFPLAAYPIYKIGRKLRNLSLTNQQASGRFNSQMSETLQYSKLVKAYHCEDFEIKRMGKIIDEMLKLGRKITRLSLVASPFVETLAGVGVALVIWYGGHQVVTGQTTSGAFFSFFTAMIMAYKPLKSLSSMNSGVQSGLAATERFYQAMDQAPLIIDKVGAIELKEVKGGIKFENVTFGYSDDKTALDKVNLEIQAGKTMALVGHSGGGKSTIINMILRFYDAKSGVVSIDGFDVRDVTIKSLRKSMSVVNQEVMLFDDTIMENIRYGKENATEEEIIKAAKLAEADDFIGKLPEGYNTKVGQNGVRLSGGQRQRIAIARAILYNAPILLLDEATSSLDPISENLIKNALNGLMKGRTTVVIAHRLSTVINADKIYVIADGKVVEFGTHRELLAKNGDYANLYSKQFELELDK